MEIIKSAQFIKSSDKIDVCPPADYPEFAFIGRSNVGKSSLINMLTQRNKLAKTSARPGKTQLINHFLINETWSLVDLPGYGWAKLSKTQKAAFGPMISDYILKRENLLCTFMLVDCRLEPQKADVAFLNWLGENQRPVAIIFTKTDKQSVNKTQSSIARFKKVVKKDWEEFPPYFTSSALKKEGREEILQFINEMVKAWEKLG